MSTTVVSIVTVTTEALATLLPVCVDRAVNRVVVLVIKAVMMTADAGRAAPQMPIAPTVLPAVIPDVVYPDARAIRTVPRALASTAIRKAENAQKAV